MTRPEAGSVAPATYQDVLDAPEHLVAELIDGTLHRQPRPARLHTACASVLGMLIGPPFGLGRGGPGGWWILDEPEIHFEAQVLIPDLAGWRRTETPTLVAEEAFYTERPNWVCEVLSPSTARHDRLRKMEVYARHQVDYAWLVDPLARLIEVYENRDGVWARVAAAGDEAAAALPPFVEVPLKHDVLWGQPG